MLNPWTRACLQGVKPDAEGAAETGSSFHSTADLQAMDAKQVWIHSKRPLFAASAVCHASGVAITPSKPALNPHACQVRRVLIALGLPGSGTPQKLVQRALAVAAAVEAGESLAAGVETARKLR
jgi:hypothetical protein